MAVYNHVFSNASQKRCTPVIQILKQQFLDSDVPTVETHFLDRNQPSSQSPKPEWILGVIAPENREPWMWGITSSPLCGITAVLYSTHARYSIEYIVPSDEMSTITFACEQDALA